MQKEEHCHYLFKFVIMGDQQVGKSCLLSQYINSKFKDDYEQTIGVEFESKIIEVSDDMKIQIQSWETSGDEQFKTITRSFFKKYQNYLSLQPLSSAAGIFMYDITNRQSFQSIKQNWFKDFKQATSDMVQCVLIGSKQDLHNQRVISKEEGEKLSQEMNAKFYEIDLHDSEKIEGIFRTLSYEVYRLLLTRQIDPSEEQYGIKDQREDEQQTEKEEKENQQQIVEKVQKDQSQNRLIVYLGLPILIAFLIYQFLL